MNKTQKDVDENEGKENSQKGSGKVADEKNTQRSGGGEKNGGKSGAVLGDLNGEAKHKEK